MLETGPGQRPADAEPEGWRFCGGGSEPAQSCSRPLHKAMAPHLQRAMENQTVS